MPISIPVPVQAMLRTPAMALSQFSSLTTNFTDASLTTVFRASALLALGALVSPLVSTALLERGLEWTACYLPVIGIGALVVVDQVLHHLVKVVDPLEHDHVLIGRGRVGVEEVVEVLDLFGSRGGWAGENGDEAEVRGRERERR